MAQHTQTLPFTYTRDARVGRATVVTTVTAVRVRTYDVGSRLVEVTYDETVHHLDVEDNEHYSGTVRFSGSVYGEPGPIVALIGTTGRGIHVTDPGRYGHVFDADWAINYVLDREV